MRLVVTGSRFGRHDVWRELDRFVEERVPPAFLILGDASGVDECARRWAEARGYQYIVHRADWATHGERAGVLRNQLMVDAAEPGDWCVAFPSAGSKGTWDCARRAVRGGLRVLIVPWPPSL